MTSELNPCPFCGGEAEIERYGCTKFSTSYRCQDCGCSLETSETFNHGREWNTRATPSESMGLGGSCETTELLNDLRFRLENMPPDGATDGALINRIIKRVDQLSSTPSADTLAGLVRYSWGECCMEANDKGWWVKHSEAAKIITAERAKKDELQLKLEERLSAEQFSHEQSGKSRDDWRKRAEAAEAELDKLKAQEPVGFSSEYGLSRVENVGCAKPFQTAIIIRNQKDQEYKIPLYTAPVSDSLKAASKTLVGILTDALNDEDVNCGSVAGGYLCGDAMSDAIAEVRTALNVEASPLAPEGGRG